MSFQSLTTPTRISSERFSVTIPDGWQQGRGAFGGFMAAILVRSLETAHGDPERPLRSLHVQFAGPALPGPAEVSVRPVHPGTGISFWDASASQGTEVVSHAMATFGRRRVADGSWRTLLAPDAPAWRAIEPLAIAPPFGPAFALHFEYRPCLGALPMAGLDRAHTGGWVKAKDAGPARDAAYAAALLDSWWPSAYARFSTMRPMATVAYTMQTIDGFEGLDPEEPFLIQCRSDAARDGYCLEERELWGHDGRLVAANQQTMAVLR
jgi:acyl-CoA thioesterase